MPFSGACKAAFSAGGLGVAAVVVQLVWTPEPGGWLRLVQFLMVCGFAVMLLAAWLCAQRVRAGRVYDAALDAEMERVSQRVTKPSQPVTSLRAVGLDPPAPASLSRPRRAWGSLSVWGAAGAVGLVVGGGTVWAVASGPDRSQPATRQVRQVPSPPTEPVAEVSPEGRPGYVRRPAPTVSTERGTSSAARSTPEPLAPRQRGPSDEPHPEQQRPGQRQSVDVDSPAPVTGRAPDADATTSPRGSEPRPHTHRPRQPVLPPPADPTVPPSPVATAAPVAPSPPVENGARCKIMVKDNGVAVDGCTGMEIELRTGL